MQIIECWPGKSPDERGVAHPAVYHMLDVAAVAERLPLANSEPAVLQACYLLAGLHDLGKINAAFRAMLRSGQPQPAGRHWEVTEALLRHHDAAILEPVLGATWRVRNQLFAASAGHHGAPPTRDEVLAPWEWQPMLTAAGPEAVADAGAVITAFLELWPGASLERLDRRGAAALSWRLAGWITAADWVGSNPAWFQPTAPGPTPAEYLELARSRAAVAVAAAGLHTGEPCTRRLYDFAPRPMQAACTEVALPKGPMLAIIEDETGSGKTEAALILAQRMMTAGKGRGLYMALPTMATADAMFDRLAGVLRRLFDGTPSLALAHGRAGMHKGFRALAEARALNPDEPGPTDWLRDNRRRALLADVGVGTVDQALLAAVRARHAVLRQYGLASKILIVDEAHEMGDPYMGTLLAELLRVQAAQGGSAILMSATLDRGLRARLAAGFAAGRGDGPKATDHAAYPALTVPGVAAPAVAAHPSPRGPVAVVRLDEMEAALDLLERAAGQGAACVLVRNAVDEAIAAARALRARGVPTDLLHARFALVDRKRHEGQALAGFGKGRAARPGRVLVATQVVESSLDLDFDVMVSDLAPMAALIQRAGRLWRHMDLRPADGRPAPGPVLHVLAPDPDGVTSDRWAQPVLGQGAFVYPAPLLWRTARVLFDAGAIEAPHGLRALVEAAHGSDLPLPEVLETAALRQEGQDAAAVTHAGQNLIDWPAGYRAGAAGAGDAEYPTRLGRPQMSLVLMRDGAPWSGGAWDADACQLSQVQASAIRLSRLPLPEAPPPNLPEALQRGHRFVPVGEGGEICHGLRYDAAFGLIFD